MPTRLRDAFGERRRHMQYVGARPAETARRLMLIYCYFAVSGQRLSRDSRRAGAYIMLLPLVQWIGTSFAILLLYDR